MKQTSRKFCHFCTSPIGKKMEGDSLRDYCSKCGVYFYDNPLPVASTIVVKKRRVLLVKRGNDPHKGKWCLPSGFAETRESIAEAALRELHEETGIKGRIVQLVDVDSHTDSYYGDLLFLTFEVELTGGEPAANDDAEEVKYFPIATVPKLAFPSNNKALRAYINSKQDYWAIIDSFNLAAGEEQAVPTQNLLSNKLIELIEHNSKAIARLWLDDVTGNSSTPTYHDFDQNLLFNRVELVLAHFGEWLTGTAKGFDIKPYYFHLGRTRKREGFTISELISALSLTKKHIWEFALSRGMWDKTIDIYKILELERRISLFFDKATFYVSQGYEG